jgi:hypothetical protein
VGTIRSPEGKGVLSLPGDAAPGSEADRQGFEQNRGSNFGYDIFAVEQVFIPARGSAVVPVGLVTFSRKVVALLPDCSNIAAEPTMVWIASVVA